MNNPNIKETIIANYNCQVGEGCLWHNKEQAIYWVDIPNGKMFKYLPNKNQHLQIYHDRPIGGFTIQKNGNLLCFRDKGNIVLLSPNGKVIKTVIQSIPALKSTRFNDVVATPKGSVFAGTMSSDSITGKLYHFKADGSYKIVLDNQGTPNGMGFSPDASLMYYQDSRQQKLWSFRYNYLEDNIDNPTLLRVAKESGDPGRGDGLCVDNNGNIWSARWDGASVLQCNNLGIPINKYDLSAKSITSVCFGGKDLSDIFITSANKDNKKSTTQNGGALFKLNLGIKGKLEYLSQI